jgi:hypothetical protein
VPGIAPPQKNRPVGHGIIGRRRNPRGIPRRKVRRCFLRKANQSNHRIGAHTGANQTVPYGTALLRWRCPRHFVPGYDQTVPPGLEAKPHRSNKSSQIFLIFAPFNPGLSFPGPSSPLPLRALHASSLLNSRPSTPLSEIRSLDLPRYRTIC